MDKKAGISTHKLLVLTSLLRLRVTTSSYLWKLQVSGFSIYYIHSGYLGLLIQAFFFSIMLSL